MPAPGGARVQAEEVREVDEKWFAPSYACGALTAGGTRAHGRVPLVRTDEL